MLLLILDKCEIDKRVDEKNVGLLVPILSLVKEYERSRAD